MGALEPPGEQGQLDRALVAAWLRHATERLAAHQPQIDAANVFPVADHDTGTNLLATMRAGLEAASEVLDAGSATAGEVSARALHGALGGARGNSGAILAQFWRAVAETLARRRPDAAGYAQLLARSVVLVQEALAEPVEGTAWSVLRAAADQAGELAAGGAQELSQVAGPVVEAAVLALARTPEQLPPLARAQVVDAGGLGVLCVLDALAEAVEESAGSCHVEKPAIPWSSLPIPEPQRHGAALASPYHEVEMEVLDLEEGTAAQLRAQLAALGDSVVVAGDGARWKVHAHTADAGAVVLAGINAGRVVAVRITNLPAAAREQSRAVLALAAGEGLAALFREAGAQVLDVAEGVSAKRLAGAVAQLVAEEVFVLPNGAFDQPELIRAASEIRASGRAARFLPCASPVQGLAAVAVHDPGRPAGDDEYTMASAAAGARWACLVAAQEEAFTWAGKCSAGDFLGLVGEEVVLVSPDRGQAGRDLVDLLLASGGELVTVLLGQEGDESIAQDLAEHMRKRHPGIELVVLDGGQPGEIVQVGVE